MSATNFYQTFYQSDQLFRLPDESWTVSGRQSVEELEKTELITLETALVSDTSIDLLRELDALAATSASDTAETLRIDTEVVVPMVTSPEPEPIVLVTAPEPLPQPAPRPTVPSVLPPVQHPRMPQLNHKVLLLADEELDPSNLLFLEKILKAVNLNIDGVDLLNLHGSHDLDFAELVQDKKIHHFITFGVPFNRIHLDIAMDRYQPVRFFGITFLMADSLPTIEADQNLKKRLWGALQYVFLQR